MSRKYVTPEGFHAALKAGDSGESLVIAMGDVAEVKKADDVERTFDFIASTAALDRHGDSINQDGWHLDDYRKNPVFLWAHNHSMPPIGKAVEVRIEDGKLKMRVKWLPKGMNRFADQIHDLYELGFLSAVSVGFMPKRWEWAKGEDRKLGIDFHEQSLLELSGVPIPANPEAGIDIAKSAGVAVDLYEDWMRKTFGFGPEHVPVLQSRLNELHADSAELKKLKAKQIVRPEPKQAVSRLARCALRLSKIKKA